MSSWVKAAIQYPLDTTGNTTRLTLTNLSVRKPKQASFKNLDTGKRLTFDVGESLRSLTVRSSAFPSSRSEVPNIPPLSRHVTLSNGQVLATGDTLAARVYSDTSIRA